MKKHIVTIVGIAIIAILLSLSLILYVNRDMTAPTIDIEEMNITYTQGENYDELMVGVSAYDNKDGDLTDNVFIDRITEINNGKAVIHYAVIDTSNNVGTAKRIVSYITDPLNNEDIADEEQDEEQVEEQEDEEVSVEDEEVSAEDEVLTEELTDHIIEPNGAIPVLALTTTEHTITAGEAFNIASVVRDVVDDVDTREELFRHIRITEDYDIYTPGSYVFGIYVMDSDGNTSEPQILTLTIQ